MYEWTARGTTQEGYHIAPVNISADEQGMYNFTYSVSECDDRQFKSHLLTAWKSGFKISDAIKLKCTNDLQTINFRLVPIIGDYEIRVQGIVIDAVTNRTIADALVTLWEEHHWWGTPEPEYMLIAEDTTDIEGYYNISHYVDYGCPNPEISASKHGLSESYYKESVECGDNQQTINLYIPRKP